MSLEIWLTFVMTSSIILVIPGPTIIYVVGQSLAHGRRASLPLSIGVILGDAVCIMFSLLGLSALLSIFSSTFIVVKYVGAVYLAYLGIKMIISNATIGDCKIQTKEFNSKILFRDVMFVNAFNPKGIIFFSAFMPQFVSGQDSVLLQLFMLSLTFLILALINVVFYSLLASRASELFASVKFTKMFNLTGGLSLLFAGICSATIERD
jgi:homoserine/homoserine lactone efflux protein